MNKRINEYRINEYAQELANGLSDYLKPYSEEPGRGLCGVEQLTEDLYEVAHEYGYQDLNDDVDDDVISHLDMYVDYVRNQAIPDGSWSDFHLTERGIRIKNGEELTERAEIRKLEIQSYPYIDKNGSTLSASEYLTKIYDKELKRFFTNEYDFFDTEVSGKTKFFADVKSDLSTYGGVTLSHAHSSSRETRYTINIDKECTNEAKEYIDAAVEVVKDAMIYPYHGEWTSYLNERGLLQRSFISACRNGNFAEVKDTVLNSGTDMVAEVTALDNAGLVQSSSSGHLEITKFLISNGADIHAQNDKALKNATLNKHVRIVEEMFDNSKDKSKSLEIISGINKEFGDFIKKRLS